MSGGSCKTNAGNMPNSGQALHIIDLQVQCTNQTTSIYHYFQHMTAKEQQGVAE